MKNLFFLTTLAITFFSMYSCNSFNAADYNNDIIEPSTQISLMSGDLDRPSSKEAYDSAVIKAVEQAELGIKHCKENPDFNGDSSLSTAALAVYESFKELYSNNDVKQVVYAQIAGNEESITNAQIDTYNGLVNKHSDLVNTFNSIQREFATTNDVQLTQ